MIVLKGFFKILLLSVALLTASAGAEGFNESAQCGFRYGPNLSWQLVGNTPFVWGQWLPQAFGALHYTWLEPIDKIAYGDTLERVPSYWRMDGALELTPFYGGYSAGIGLHPFKTNPQIELNFTYESYLFFRSNIEMVNAEVEGSGKIAETWNADYVVDNIWQKENDWDYAQWFDFSITLSYEFPLGSVLGLNLHYILSDISTDFDGKSYDYKRNIPVFSRDFLTVLEIYGRIPFNENVAMVFESDFYRTGYLRSKNTVQKESLSYGMAMVGPHFSWNRGMQNISLQVGGWRRVEKRFYNGSLPQKFLIQLKYQGYFSFPFNRNFSE